MYTFFELFIHDVHVLNGFFQQTNQTVICATVYYTVAIAITCDNVRSKFLLFLYVHDRLYRDLHGGVTECRGGQGTLLPSRLGRGSGLAGGCFPVVEIVLGFFHHRQHLPLR